MTSSRQYWAIKQALTPTEKEMINYYEIQWHLRQNVPTVDEVVNYLRNLYEKQGKHHRPSHTSVNYYLARTPVIKALEKRGIPFRQHTQEELTPTQIAAATTVMNFADERSIADKLDQLGVQPATYYAWLNDPTFNAFVNAMADQNKVNIRPQAVAEFTKKVNSGDWNAVKYFLEVTGEFTNPNDQPQSEQMLRMIIEIIQDEVKDPELIMRIANRMKLAAANRTLEVVTTPPAITSSVVEDPELEDAKKKLGIV